MSNGSMDPYLTAGAMNLVDKMTRQVDGMAGYPHQIPLQQGLPSVECGACLPTHCMRTVSQRTLNVPTVFMSADQAIPAGGDIWTSLVIGPAGAIDPLDGDGFLIFNDANNQAERARIVDLVLFAIRVNIRAHFFDETAVADGINLDRFGDYFADLVGENTYLSLFHTADRDDPWVRATSLNFWRRAPQQRQNEFMLVPPVKWVSRDPAMALSFEPIVFGHNAPPGPPADQPLIESPRDLRGKLSINIECMFLPDPAICGPLWPGSLCPVNTIGNTPGYTGKINTARLSQAGARG